MQHTEQQIQEFRTEFLKRRRRQILLAVPVVLAMVGMMSASGRPGETVLGLPAQVAAVGFVSLVGLALVLSFTNWRCPACNRYLGKTISPRFCAKCGVSLGETR